MTNRQIETSREIRLWVGQIIIPVIGVLIVTPESRKWMIDKYKDIKRRVSRRKFFSTNNTGDQKE